MSRDLHLPTDSETKSYLGYGQPKKIHLLLNSKRAGESVGNDRLTLLAQLEGDDERWSAQHHALPRLARLGSRRRAEYV